ncbi:DUF4293 family protein [Blattabacterium cuenoti]|uniref:DUF4293 family protein n=1 Tax=Blattabacterium cuenoti TaxID=1653831 RepID=UPI00163C41FD|nr:DUF4293 family protein [Blattabacterium cuenoti]
MLYRIQSLYLLISIFIYSFSIYFFYKKQIIIFTIICLLLSILSFLFFNKKKLQIYLNKINILSNIIHVIIIFFSYSYYDKYTLCLILFFLLLCIYILFMANRAIKKDIELIDSINRIR